MNLVECVGLGSSPLLPHLSEQRLCFRREQGGDPEGEVGVETARMARDQCLSWGGVKESTIIIVAQDSRLIAANPSPVQ